MTDEPVEAVKVIEEELHEDPAPEPEAETPETEDFNPTRLEDLDPNEELWEGGPKIGNILAWKQEYGDIYVTSLTLDKHVVWRTMDRGEYKTMIRTMEELTQRGSLTSAEIQLFQEDYVSDLAILFPEVNPEEKDRDLAGLATIIAQEVMDASGFVALEVRQL